METCSSMLEPLSQDFIHFCKKSFLIALFTWNEAACLFLTFVLPSLSTDTDDIDDKNMTWQSHSLTAAALHTHCYCCRNVFQQKTIDFVFSICVSVMAVQLSAHVLSTYTTSAWNDFGYRNGFFTVKRMRGHMMKQRFCCLVSVKEKEGIIQ